MPQLAQWESICLAYLGLGTDPNTEERRDGKGKGEGMSRSESKRLQFKEAHTVVTVWVLGVIL